MATIMKMEPAKNQACSHCNAYHGNAVQTEGGRVEHLCGNCQLKKPEVRAAERKHIELVNEGRKRADAAAKKAFLEEMRKINAENVDATLGGTHEDRVKNAE